MLKRARFLLWGLVCFLFSFMVGVVFLSGYLGGFLPNSWSVGVIFPLNPYSLPLALIQTISLFLLCAVPLLLGFALLARAIHPKDPLPKNSLPRFPKTP